MRAIARFVIPAILVVFSLFLLPELQNAFGFINSGDKPGIYLSLVALPLLLPAGIFAIVSPRLGGMILALIGVLGVAGVLLTPTFFSSSVYVGLGPAVYLVAAIDGAALRWFEGRHTKSKNNRLL